MSWKGHFEFHVKQKIYSYCRKKLATASKF